MRTIKIDGTDYKFEYSIEACLYEDCCGCIMDLFVGQGMTEGAAKSGDIKTAWSELKKSITGNPKTALTLFYAGLLENHGDEILSIDDVKPLFKKHIEESGKSIIEVTNELMEIVDEDNFFGLLGLDKMFQTEGQTESNMKEKKNKKPGKSTSTEQ